MKVRNRSMSTVGYDIPDLRAKRHFAPGEIKEIPKEELENYSIYGDFTASGLYVEGDWKVTFPLEKN